MSKPVIYNPCSCGSTRAYRFCCRSSLAQIPEEVACPPTYVRFVTAYQDPSSHSLQGIIHSVSFLRNYDFIHGDEEIRVDEAIDWLNIHLDVPPCLKQDDNARAICWFHPRARAPISIMWEIASVLREHGQYVTLITARDPGLILYRDRWQVVAKPRRKSARAPRRGRRSVS